MAIALALLVLWVFETDNLFAHKSIHLVFALVYIITSTCLFLLKNWARITYIIFHIILASFVLYLFLMGLTTWIILFGMGEYDYLFDFFIISLPLLIYFIISIIYFLRSDTAKLFKQ